MTVKRVECLERLAKKELQIAEFYAKRKAWESVRRRSNEVLQDFPDSEYAPEAKVLQVQALAELDQWDELQSLWKQVQTESPDAANKLRQTYTKLP